MRIGPLASLRRHVKGGRSEEVLRGLISQAVAAARSADNPAVPVIQPGEGDPAWERRFREVADGVRGQIRLPADLFVAPLARRGELAGGTWGPGWYLQWLDDIRTAPEIPR